MVMLDEICEWRQEERGEAHHRYFYAFDDVERVVAGKRCFVLGRKGAGKTAIAEHIKSISDGGTFVQKLTFRSFPFKPRSMAGVSARWSALAFWRRGFCYPLRENMTLYSDRRLRGHAKGGAR
jgi:hypothetical protein